MSELLEKRMHIIARTLITALLLITAVSATTATAAQVMTHTLNNTPAIVLTAFGTSTKAQVTYKALERQVRGAFPGHEIRWAFTSEVIRERVNRRWEAAGKAERLLSLGQALSNLEAKGYTKVVVQPLHIFPGSEYGEVLEAVKHFPGLAIETGEALLQRWKSVQEVIKLISTDFYSPEQGCNVVVAHGTPSTHVGSNIAYLGLDRYLLKRFENVYLGTVDGVITREDALDAAKKCSPKKVRFIPLMFVAGNHIMRDIMGDEVSPEGPSWKMELEAAGFAVETPTFEYEGQTYLKGLGFNPEVNALFLRQIARALKRF
jgi:sirohydrochlorin cobaltochelatase